MVAPDSRYLNSAGVYKSDQAGYKDSGGTTVAYQDSIKQIIVGHQRYSVEEDFFHDPRDDGLTGGGYHDAATYSGATDEVAADPGGLAYNMGTIHTTVPIRIDDTPTDSKDAVRLGDIGGTLGSIGVAIGQKIVLDTDGGSDTYFIFDGTELTLYINGTPVHWWR